MNQQETTLCPPVAEIRAEIAAILASPAFQSSKRSQQFLAHVCGKAIDGQTDALKERTLAVEVFGRSPDSDLGEDTIVRVGAREVRKRLAQYYATPAGAGAKIRIELAPGTYVPEFRYVLAPAPVEQPAAEALPVAPQRPASGVWRKAVLAVAAAAVLTAAMLLAARMTRSPASNSFERFWAPAFESKEPILVAVGHPLVYHPSLRAIRLNEAALPPPPYPMQRPLQLPANQVNGSDLIPVPNQYVGFGDLVVATEVAQMLGSRSKQMRIRLANSVAFADLRKTQTLLIGAMTNHWTMELSQPWRFKFDRHVGQSNVIADTQASTGPKQWSVPSSADGQAREDFVLICRVPNSSTGGLVLVAAGIKQFGTEAAGHLLSDPAMLSPVLDKLPAGWESKNLQIVLAVKVIGNTPAQPELAAFHVW